MRCIKSGHRSILAPAFTLAELMVSITILVLIATAVAGDINRTRYQEELASTVRVVIGSFRDLQTRALAATSVKTCVGAAAIIQACEVATTGCVGACTSNTAPYAVGSVIATNGTSMTRFAEVDASLNDRRQDATREDLGVRKFLEGLAGTGFVKVQSLTTDQGVVASATVTFDRQNGTMRINACDTPAPYTPLCAGVTEPKTLVIALVHQRTNQVRTIRLNTVTGKIAAE